MYLPIIFSLTSIISYIIFGSISTATCDDNFEFHVTRSSNGDTFFGKGFRMVCLHPKQRKCRCGKKQFFLLEPRYEEDNEYIYGCVKNYSEGEPVMKLANQTGVPTLVYKENSWHFPASSVISRRDARKTVTCKNLEIIEVFKLDYFEKIEIEKHPFSLETIASRTYKLVINKDVSQEKYEGELIQITFSCRGRESTMLLKFKGTRVITGDESPEFETLVKPTSKPTPKTTPSTNQKAPESDTSLIIGVTVGCIGVLLIVLALIVFLCIIRRSKPIVVTQDRRNRSSSAPPAYPGLEMVPPSYELPRKPSIFDYTQEGMLMKSSPGSTKQIPRRTPSPLPPTPPSYLDNNFGNGEYEKPLNDSEDTYASLYLKMIDTDPIDSVRDIDSRHHNDNNTMLNDEVPSSLPTMSPLSPLYRTLEEPYNFSTEGIENTIPIPSIP